MVSGRQVEVPNELWPTEPGDTWDPKGRTVCTVVSQCAKGYAYGMARAAPSHIIECDGTNFPVKTAALETFFAQQAARRKRQRTAV